MEGRSDEVRIGVLVVAYNAASTLASVLDRIPADFRARLDVVLVADDASTDSTFLIGVGYRETMADLPVVVVRHEDNLGYGGNQQWGYGWAAEHDLDVVVLLHGDGQYAPEMLGDMVAPILAGEADAVLGSRMALPLDALRGGMPLYKWVGNRILTTVQNALAGTDLSEWHSGYRAYRVDSLRRIDLDALSDDFDFDTQILLELLATGSRIGEIPIPTYYGDEISYVNGMRYARQVVRHSLAHRARRIGFGRGGAETYEEKTDDGSSHRRVVALVGDGPGRVLDLGTGAGHVARALRGRGHDVVAVDVHDDPDWDAGVGQRVVADLDRGLPADVDGSFETAVVADVLEHLRDPGALLDELHGRLAPGGRVVGSVPNFAHWYPRVRVLAGRFDYDDRGILDRGHLRFFTRRSFRSLCAAHGFRLAHLEPIGLPFEVLSRGGAGDDGGAGPSGVGGRLVATVAKVAGSVDRALVRAWPTLFAFQFAFVLEPVGPAGGATQVPVAASSRA